MDREKVKLLTAQLYGLLSTEASDEEIEKKIEELAHELKHLPSSSLTRENQS